MAIFNSYVSLPEGTKPSLLNFYRDLPQEERWVSKIRGAKKNMILSWKRVGNHHFSSSARNQQTECSRGLQLYHRVRCLTQTHDQFSGWFASRFNPHVPPVSSVSLVTLTCFNQVAWESVWSSTPVWRGPSRRRRPCPRSTRRPEGAE